MLFRIEGEFPFKSCLSNSDCFGQAECGRDGHCTCAVGYGRDTFYFFGMHCTISKSFGNFLNLILILMTIPIVIILIFRLNDQEYNDKSRPALKIALLVVCSFSLSKICNIIEGFDGVFASSFYAIAICAAFKIAVFIVLNFFTPLARKMSVSTEVLFHITNLILITLYVLIGAFLVTSQIAIFVWEDLGLYNSMKLAVLLEIGALAITMAVVVTLIVRKLDKEFDHFLQEIAQYPEMNVRISEIKSARKKMFKVRNLMLFLVVQNVLIIGITFAVYMTFYDVPYGGITIALLQTAFPLTGVLALFFAQKSDQQDALSFAPSQGTVFVEELPDRHQPPPPPQAASSSISIPPQLNSEQEVRLPIEHLSRRVSVENLSEPRSILVV